MALLEELNDVRSGLVALDLALVLEDGEARKGKINLWLELVGLKVSSQQSVEFLSHA